MFLRFAFVLVVPVLIGAGCSSAGDWDYVGETSTYSDGYDWAEDEDVDDFEDCQDEFGSSSAEDGCNEYIRENYTGYRSFGSYDCTEDCSGHEAGYEWAEDNGIDDEDDCNGYSQSFIEGCWQYVEDNY